MSELYGSVELEATKETQAETLLLLSLLHEGLLCHIALPYRLNKL